MLRENRPPFSNTCKNHLIYAFLAVNLIAFLIPIWGGKYMLTGDGPTHVYNSRILADWMLGKDLEFYQQIYELNLKPDPNWVGHALLSCLMLIFSPALAQKLLLSGYVGVFTWALFHCIRHIHRENLHLVLLGLPFIFHFSFFKGFWNCAISFAIGYWAIMWWMKNRYTLAVSKLLAGSLLISLLYFSHLLGLAMALGAVGGMILIELFIYLSKKNNLSQQQLLYHCLSALFIFLPALILVGFYLSRVGIQSTSSTLAPQKLLDQYLILTGLQNIGTKPFEAIGIKLIAFSFHFLLGWGIYRKIKSRQLTVYDGFFLAFLVFFIFYLFQPQSVAGGSVLVRRLQIIPYLLLLGWFAQFSYSPKVRLGWACLFFIASMGIQVSRIPAQERINQGLSGYLSAFSHIEPRSTVLPLSFSHFGLDSNRKPLSQMWLFIHAGDYAGAEKPLILLNNYEASSGAFPLIYRNGYNPLELIGTNEGLEFEPPSVAIYPFEEKTGLSVDYVVTWCRNLVDSSHAYWKHTDIQLTNSYHLVFTSPDKRVEVFKRNP
ncbi:MAG: hypothetical protein AAF694_30275 [Bacteroidota bacterium]